jgi:hypothetical protein
MGAWRRPSLSHRASASRASRLVASRRRLLLCVRNAGCWLRLAVRCGCGADGLGDHMCRRHTFHIYALIPQVSRGMSSTTQWRCCSLLTRDTKEKERLKIPLFARALLGSQTPPGRFEPGSEAGPHVKNQAVWGRLRLA